MTTQEKINVVEQCTKQGWMGRFFLAVMVSHSKHLDAWRTGLGKGLDKLAKPGSFDEVKLIVGGVEMPVTPFVESLRDQYEDMVKKEALLLFQETMRSKFNNCEEILSSMQKELRRSFKDTVGIEHDEDDFRY